MNNTEVQEMLIYGMGLKFLWMIAGIVLLLIILRIFDKIAGVQFRKSFDTIEKDPVALALYFGLRFVAVCYVIGQILG